MSTTIYPATRICADFIARALASSRTSTRPLFFGLQGPQGCGKTTLASQTQTALRNLPTPVHAVVFSIDDLYLPYSGLTQLARTHPDNDLLNGRGQPGTHDPELGKSILEDLAHINEKGGEISMPVFDKSAYGGYGDRSDEVEVVRPPVDVVILEGWCLGFQPLEEEELKKRYNSPDAKSGISTSPQSEPFFKRHSLTALADINHNLEGYADLWYRYFTHFIQASLASYLIMGSVSPIFIRV
ncbi:ATP-dependent kinase TDA10 [Ceratobasidium sp. AG-Ba]|nr:ATP-dependent kinase TDA10 [Ceratobasidium sp. AG-Ba]QRW13484.1 ATP-dependent kinase TDA10 [Ceratobasidium sp. AG-Ba]